MAFMKRNVNLGLLVLIVASLMLFTGFAVYYQTTFKDITLEYNTKLEELQKVTSELGLQKQALNETYELKVKAERDRSALDTQYRDISDENLQFQRDNTNLRVEVTQTKSELGATKTDLENKKVILAQTQSDLASANSQVSSLKSRRDSLEDDVDRICTKLIAAGGSDSDCD